MSEAALIGIDWGTSNRRAWLLDRDGRVIARRRDGNGIAVTADAGFAAGLDQLVKGWPRLPTLMAGMIGSRNGWLEASYVECPAGVEEIAARLVPVGDRADTAIVPGLSMIAGRGDVIRCEETQVVGFASGDRASALAVLPGSHAKWVRIAGGRIDSFRTFPTGELFRAILDHTVIGALAEGEVTAAGFERGLARAGESCRLLADLFAARADILLGLSPARDCAGYLSGLLIGSEIREGLALYGRQDRIVVAGADEITVWYERALERSGVAVERLGEDVTASGLWRIATVAGLVSHE
jgi:2-dehydro-3-deoxygalactonokinase